MYWRWLTLSSPEKRGRVSPMLTPIKQENTFLQSWTNRQCFRPKKCYSRDGQCAWVICVHRGPLLLKIELWLSVISLVYFFNILIIVSLKYNNWTELLSTGAVLYSVHIVGWAHSLASRKNKNLSTIRQRKLQKSINFLLCLVQV